MRDYLSFKLEFLNKGLSLHKCVRVYLRLLLVFRQEKNDNRKGVGGGGGRRKGGMEDGKFAKEA